MGAGSLSVTIVNACTRSGRGGSPTAIVDGVESTDSLRDVARVFNTSHAVSIRRLADEGGVPAVALRFFTAEQELPACGHGTVAALALLATEARGGEYRARIHSADRSFSGRAIQHGGFVDAYFTIDHVDLRPASAEEAGLVAAALGAPREMLLTGASVASPGRARILLPLAAPSAVAALEPDLDRLRTACGQLGLLGCYVHSPPDQAGRLTARMFAPSIGVAEDIANANSTACLAALLSGDKTRAITVDMGDCLGRPATLKASVTQTPRGKRIEVGGTASIAPAR